MIMESGTASAIVLDRAAPSTDAQLVAAVRRGDDRAFERLYERYQRRISAFVYGMVNDHGRAEDVTQEVFISALRRMRQTDRPLAFKPWIYEIAKNACIDQFRRSRRTEEVSFDAEEGAGALESARLAAPGATPDAAVSAKQQLNDLCGAFGGLSDTHHEILVLRELEGLSYREIGERLGLSRPSVESTLFRARRRLTEEYDELVSGERCLRVQAMLGAGSRSLGTRDELRLARHVAHCQSCRRQARAAGLDTATLSPRRRTIAARVAAFLPLPAFLRLRRGNSTLGDGQSATLAQWSGAVSSMAEPAVGWAKAAAAAAALLLAGGAGVVGDAPSPSPSAPSAPAARTEPAPAPPSAASKRGKLKPAAVGQRPARAARPAKRIVPAAAHRERRPAPAAPEADSKPSRRVPDAPGAGRPTAPTGGPKLPLIAPGGSTQRSGSPGQAKANVGTDPVDQSENVVTKANGPAGRVVGDARAALGLAD